MTGARDHRRWRADLAAYLLGSLDGDETEAMERHLDGCQRCRDELRWLQPAIDLIPESTPQLAPPPALRERLLAEVRAEAADLAEGRAGRRAAPRRRFISLRQFLLRPAVALTAVALIGAAIGGFSLGGGGDGKQTQTMTTIADLGQNKVRAALERSGDSGTLVLNGLPQAPSAHVYQVWVQHGDRIEPSSLFDARHGTASTSIPHDLQGADAVMVTVEPRGGSGQPSSPPVIRFALAN